MNEIIISIICNTYNHEAYIRQALEGFCNQRTEYAYEILVHDDASTDHTADIIREYEMKYPELIKPIYQVENQYSKGVNVSDAYQYHRAKGKYIAMCEGDDYWIDPEKLQIQISYLEAHPECSGSVHETMVIDENGNSRKHFFGCKDEMDIETLNELLIFPHTTSYVFHNPFLDMSERGSFLVEYLSYWDKSIAIYMVATGKVHYFPRVMSCYRYVSNTGTSFQARMKRTNMTKEIMEAELSHYRQIKAYQLPIDMSAHYYRNVNIYSIVKWINYPSIRNARLIGVGLKNSPFSKSKMILYFMKFVKEKLWNLARK